MKTNDDEKSKICKEITDKILDVCEPYSPALMCVSLMTILIEVTIHAHKTKSEFLDICSRTWDIIEKSK
jgi:hypothetical protein